jgi:hypothetical protein
MSNDKEDNDTIYGEIVNDGSDGSEIVINNPVALSRTMSRQKKLEEQLH